MSKITIIVDQGGIVTRHDEEIPDRMAPIIFMRLLAELERQETGRHDETEECARLGCDECKRIINIKRFSVE
jgi:hypothetical protein